MQTVISIDKIIFASFSWRNQHNNLVYTFKPALPTAHGTVIAEGYATYHPDYPHETLMERARRLDIIDRWHPHLYVRMQGGVRLEFTGDRALSIWETYKAKQFGASNYEPNKRRDKKQNRKTR